MSQKFFTNYLEQVELLIEIIPFISKDKRFALKGGTALNLFLMDMPRLSVDIDLCYVPLTPRDQALKDISNFIKELSHALSNIGYIIREKKAPDGHESTIFVQSKKSEVKVEINLVVRGSVFVPTKKRLVPSAVEQFNRNAEISCLDFNDLYGGKICASLDRQHPRDFFDMYMFFKHYSYSRELHQTFIAYLLSSKRPISELISPNYLDIKEAYEKKFEGMTIYDISLKDLEETRKKVFETTAGFFNDQEKDFLISFKKGDPEWDLFPYSQIKNMPSVQWKLHNIKAMDAEKRKIALKNLERKLSR